MLNPQIMRVVNALMGNNCTLVDTALTMMCREGGEKNEGRFHGELGQHVDGSKEPGEQWKDYHVTRDGEIFAGFLNCGITLVDVPEGSGFVCMPGTHKRNFRPPDRDVELEDGQTLVSEDGAFRAVDLYDGPSSRGSPYRHTVQNICPKAGSCIVFTETLRHGIRRWEASYPRLTVFNRYKANWAQRYWGSRPPGNGEWEADDLSSCAGQLSAEMQLLQEPSAGPEAKDAEAWARAEAKNQAMEVAMAARL